jgi:hypothetical protein
MNGGGGVARPILGNGSLFAADRLAPVLKKEENPCERSS